MYKITPAGKASVVYTAKDSHIFSLATTPDGSIYAGTGPNGKVLRVAPDGKVTTAADDLDSYVWSLAYDPDAKAFTRAPGPKATFIASPRPGKRGLLHHETRAHPLPGDRRQRNALRRHR